MQDSIKAAVLKAFPELSGGLHLDKYARVTGIADQPDEGAACERFRPRFAVDIEILTPEMEPDPAFPKYTAVPLPLPAGAGGESGLMSFPEPGALVVVGFAYGRQDHPIIRQIYPMGGSLPKVAPGEVLLQKNPAVFQRADAGGNWKRVTDADIEDDSVTRSVKAVEGKTKLARESKRVSEHSSIEVGGTQSIEVGGMLTMLAGQRADLGTLGEMNLTAGSDTTYSAGGNDAVTVGGNQDIAVNGSRSLQVKGNQFTNIEGSRDECVGGDQKLEVGGNNTEKAAAAKTIEAASILLKSGSTISCVAGSGGTSIFGELLAALDEIKAALDVLASHTHPSTGTISQGGAVAGHSAGLGVHRGNIGGITK